MKKTMLITLILALVMAISAGYAENIFETLPEAQETGTGMARLTAPSYGAMANVAPDEVAPNTEGGTIVTYRNVGAAGHNRFGVYLAGLGYYVTDRDARDTRTAYAVSNGTVSFVMIYDTEGQTMQLIYPAGTDYEQPLFPGYTTVAAGDTVDIDGLGAFRFTELTLDAEVRAIVFGYAARWVDGKVYAYGSDGWKDHHFASSWIEFSYTNTAAAEKRFSEKGNDLFDAELVYIEDGKVYSFGMKDFGRYNAEKVWISTSPEHGYEDEVIFENRPCRPLETLDGAIAFDLTEGVRSSAGGTIALKLDFKTGEKILVIFR